MPGGNLVPGIAAVADAWAGQHTKVGAVLGMLQQDELYKDFPKDTGDVLKMSAEKQVELLNEMVRFDKDGELMGAMRRQYTAISQGESEADKLHQATNSLLSLSHE